MDIILDESKRMTPGQASTVDNLALAYLGDAVIELLARTNSFEKVANTENGKLHSMTVSLVSANAQSNALDKILPILTEEETAVYKRGRNVKTHTVPKHTEPGVYHRATGLEAVFGYLFLIGDSARINSLFYTGFINGISEVK